MHLTVSGTDCMVACLIEVVTKTGFTVCPFTLVLCIRGILVESKQFRSR